MPSLIVNSTLHHLLTVGKEQYGGAFKTEQVEDVKMLLSLLLLLVTLFGYHVFGDEFLVKLETFSFMAVLLLLSCKLIFRLFLIHALYM